jgi:aryl-alcohol dehydrogenase-like predicted oxidoreductase
MEYRRLGTSGFQVSALAFGTMDLHEEVMDKSLVRKAFDAGINFFDTSCSYGEAGASEIALGALIKDFPRDDIAIATKVRFGYGENGPNKRGLSRKHILHSLDVSLKRLQLDFIDLYVIHQWDPDCPVAETVGMMGDLLRSGKILYWGLSNMGAGRTMAYLAACEKLGVPHPISHQCEYSILTSPLVDPPGIGMTGLKEVCNLYGLGLTPYSPLCGGLLTGKYRQEVPENSRAVRYGDGWKKRRMFPARMDAVEKLAAIAEAAGIPMPQMSLAWLLTRDHVDSVLVGVTRKDQFAENIRALDVTLSNDVVEAIDCIHEEMRSCPAT